MKPTIVIAILLLVLGAFVFAYHGFTYTTTEKAIDLGPIQVTAEKVHTFPLPPFVGGIALVGGIMLLISERKH